MKINRTGVTRIVFIFGNFVVKIPKFSVEHSHFLKGCSANWDERRYWKLWNQSTGCDLRNKVIPTYFCSWFGLLQIQAKADVLSWDNPLTDEQIEYFNFTTDTKPPNFGYYKGNLVCIDYA